MPTEAELQDMINNFKKNGNITITTKDGDITITTKDCVKELTPSCAPSL